jgi:glycerophosphoryl diester phosphodiesterase
MEFTGALAAAQPCEAIDLATCTCSCRDTTADRRFGSICPGDHPSDWQTHATSTTAGTQGMNWYAHRGGGNLGPENTLAAFRAGAALGFRHFECDVQVSAEGMPFLMHDVTLERTTSGCGVAGQQTWADLSTLDAGRWHSEEFTGEPIVTLEGIARWSAGIAAVLDIEIKPRPGSEQITAEGVADAAARFWYGSPVPPWLSSFSSVALEQARRVAPHLSRGLLFDTPREGWLDEALALDCRSVVFHHSVVDTDLIVLAHRSKLNVLAYTVNDAVEALRLIRSEIDGIITDELRELPERTTQLR